MVDALLVGVGHLALDLVRHFLAGIHHLRRGRAVQLLDREPAGADAFIYAPVSAHLCRKGPVQRCRRTRPFDLRDYLAATVDMGAELHQRDHIPTEAKHHGEPAAIFPDKMVDVSGASQKLALADGVLFCDRLLCSSLAGGRRAGECAPYSRVDTAVDTGQEPGEVLRLQCAVDYDGLFSP